MAEAPAGTPASTQDDRKDTGTPAETKEDSVTVSAQFKKEALESWKPAAEKVNKLEEELKSERAKREELERLAYGGGARQATDPTAELVAQLQEQAQYDPVARAALMNMQSNATTQAELWLSRVLLTVPDTKRDKVASLIRLSNYQMSPEQALSTVSDPDSEATAKKLAELEAEMARLKNVKPNGSSPSTTPPATVSAGEDAQTEIKQSEYLAILRQGGQRALDLKRAVGESKTRLVMGE